MLHVQVETSVCEGSCYFSPQWTMLQYNDIYTAETQDGSYSFIVYLTTFSVAWLLTKLERIRKRVFVAYFKVLSRHVPEGAEENHNKF
jgi:hypothetical protein